VKSFRFLNLCSYSTKKWSVFITLCFFGGLQAQTEVFKEFNKWGIKDKDKIIIKPVYDTAFNFDAGGKVCLVCNKSKNTPNNRFIKLTTVSYNCNYLDKNGRRLMVIPSGADSACSIFSLSKEGVKQYQEDARYIIATVKNRKFLIGKDFKQITFKEYSDLHVTDEPGFIIGEIRTEGNMILKGLINLDEKEIVPFMYSNIKFNRRDSLIVACSAGLGNSREDDIYNYEGKKLDSYHRHIDMATKQFVIHKIFEPKEYYLIFNPKNKEEKIVYSEEASILHGEELLMRNEDHWFTYDMLTNKKKPYDHKHKK
jgi:hypothetical protein